MKRPLLESFAVMAFLSLVYPFSRKASDDSLHWLNPARWWQWSSLPVVICAVGLAILLQQWIGGRPLWLDEEMIALNLRDRAFGGAGAALWLNQSAPLAWLVAERAVLLVFGTSERALRLLPTVFGLATVLTAFWAGRRWMSVAGAASLLLLVSFGEYLTHFPNELKHYSADAFCGLLLPVLAAWVVEPATSTGGQRATATRAAGWWTTAAIAQWFANGALFVTPACALALLAIIWRREGRRAALVFAGLGLIWIAAFAVNYELGLRFSFGNEYLQRYWAFALPPASANWADTLVWLGRQADPLALKPGGSDLSILLWVAAFAGLLMGRRPLGPIGLMAALSVPVLAAVRIVPLYERLILWAVPMLYVGVALLIDTAWRMSRSFLARRTWTGAIFGLTASACVLVGLLLCADVFARGQTAVLSRDSNTNHLLDDRSAMRWLLRRQQPGDVLMTTRLALPAVWWYGSIPISDPQAGRAGNGAPVFEIRYGDPGRGCPSDELRQALAGRTRILLYMGFRFDDVPAGFDDLVLNTLNEFGTLVEGRGFATTGRAWIVDLRRPGAAASTNASALLLRGCVRLRTAERW